MIPTSTLLNQLTTLQQLKVERTLQAQVSFDSMVLMVFNGMKDGETKEETVANSNINERTYNKSALPIRIIIHQILNIKGNSKRDLIIEEANQCIYNSTEGDDAARLKKLESLFHEMKRYGLEYESANLLNEMVSLSENSPLITVYSHLYKKYALTEKLNNRLYIAFEKYCIQVSNFISGNTKGDDVKCLIKSFKNIRTLANENENKVSTAILNVSTLLLANFCNQIQLLKPNNWTLAELFKVCEFSINELHFGVEKTYLDTIYAESLQYAIDYSKFKMSKNFYNKISEIINTATYNFGFDYNEVKLVEKSENKETVINHFLHQFSKNPFTQNSQTIYS